MAEPQQRAWQQLPGESIKAYRAFVAFRDLEPNERSLQRVVSECNKSVSLIGRWSARWDWVERAQTWDDHQELRRLEARIGAKQRMDEQHLKIIEVAKTKLVQALAQSDPEELAKNFAQMMNWMTELIRLERLIRGEPESIEERRERLQVKATIEEQLRMYVPVFQELLDEDAIRLDGQTALLAGENQDEGEDGGDEMLITYDEPDDE